MDQQLAQESVLAPLQTPGSRRQRDEASFSSKSHFSRASGAVSPKKKRTPHDARSVSFAVQSPDRALAHRDEAFSFSAVSMGDWSSLEHWETRSQEKPVTPTTPKRHLRKLSTRKEPKVRRHLSWLVMREPQKRTPSAMDVILLNEALRSFKPDITPEQATTDVVTGRVARAAAALYDACGALNEGAPSSKVLAAIDDAQLATRGWSRVLAGKGSSTPLLCCPEVASIRYYEWFLNAIRDAIDLWGSDLLGPSYMDVIKGRTQWISDTPEQPSAFERTNLVLKNVAQRLTEPPPSSLPQRALQKTVYLAETIHKRSREAAIFLAAEVAFAACESLVNVPGKAVREAGIGMFAVKRHMKVLDLDTSVRKLMQKGRVANALQAADSLREAGFRAKLWAKDGSEDILWKRRSDSFRTFVPGPLYHPGSSTVADHDARMALSVAPASDFYEVEVATAEGASRLLHKTCEDRVVFLNPSVIPPGEYTGTVTETLSKRTVLDKVPFTVDKRSNASPCVFEAPLRAVEWKLLSNGGECADYKVECHIKPAVYFDAKKVQSEAEKMRISELRSILGETGGMKKNLVSRFVDLKRREAESSGGEPFPVKGVCNSEGCLEMTLPGGRCFDIVASKSRHPTLRRKESLKLPGPAPPELHWAMAAPKKICLCFNASDTFSGVNLPEATRLVVLDAGGLKSGRERPNDAAFDFLRRATVPTAFAAWDDGTSFPWTLAEATEATLASFFDKWSRCERTRSKPMLAEASDVLVVVDAASSRGFPADGLRTFMRDFPEQTFHVLVALEAPDAVVDEAVADVAMAATGSVFYVAPPSEDEVEAPAPAAPEKDFGPETLSEGALADMFDSI